MYYCQKQKKTPAAPVKNRGRSSQAMRPQHNAAFLGLEPHYTDRILPTRTDGNSGILENVGQKTIQRKVGMEFQVMKSIDVKTPDGEECGHGVLLRDCTGFKITGDMGNYEYVTKPADERSRSQIQTLKDNCNTAGEAHHHIRRYLSPSSRTRFDNGFWEYKTASDTTYYVRKSRVEKAHPQATVGIRLDKLTSFVEEYVKDTSDSMTNQRRKFILNHGGSKESVKKSQYQQLRSVRIAQSSLDSGISPEERGFLTMLSIMVQNYYLYHKYFHESPVNAKSAIPVMPRTSLYDVYARLSPEAQTRIKALAVPSAQNTAVLKFIVGESKARKGVPGSNGFPLHMARSSGVNMPQAVLAGEDNNLRRIITSLKDFLDSLPAPGGTVQGNVFESYSGISAISDADHRGFDIERSTDIGYDTGTAEVNGMLLELRDLERGVPTKDWGAIAEKVALLTCFVNTGLLTPPNS